MHFAKSHLRLALCLALFLGACHGRATAQEVSARKVYQQILRGTARVEVRLPGATASGSAWLVDRSRKLLVTNHHVVGNAESVSVHFPVYKDGQVVADPGAYPADKALRGRVVDSDSLLDLAVIQLESLPEDVQALPLAADLPQPGDRLHLVGSPGASSGFWGYTTGTVRQLTFKKTWYVNVQQQVRVRVIESQLATNRGDSGGPVVNDRGQVVGTNSGGNDSANVMTWAIDLRDVKAFVAQTHRVLEPHTAADYNLRGVRAYLRGHYDRAVAAFTEAIRLDPDLADAHSSRGDALCRQRDFDSALADCERAIALKPGGYHGYYIRGTVWFWKGDHAKAIADLSKALRIQPQAPVIHVIRGDVYRRQGNYDQAVRDYTAAIQLDPDYLHAYRQRGLAYYHQTAYDRALEDYDQVLRSNPADALTYNHRANIFFDRQEYDNAIDNYVASLKYNHPQPAMVFDNIGGAMRRKGAYDKAIYFHTRALEIDAGSARSYYMRGSAFEQMGTYDKGAYDQADRDYHQAVLLNASYAKVVPVQWQGTLRIINGTGEPLRIHVQYETLVAGQWKWLPGDPKNPTITYAWAPGHDSTLALKSGRLHARRVRLWAEGTKTGAQWLENRYADFWLASSQGSRLHQPRVNVLRFR